MNEITPKPAWAFLVKICVAVTVAVALLGAGEGMAYWLLQGREGYYTYAYQSYVLWQIAPSPNGAIHVGADGLRVTPTAACDPDAPKIWMFGGSGLWGNYVEDDETIPSYLAEASAERPACVRNFGQRGWSNTQEVIKLMLELKQADAAPEIVIFYDGSVDAQLPAESDERDVHMGFARFKEKFEHWQPGLEAGFGWLTSTNTFLGLRWVAERFQVGMGASPAPALSADRLASMSERTAENYRKNIDVVDALASKYDFKYLFVLEPILMDVEKPLAANERRLADAATDSVRVGGYERLRTAHLPHFVDLRRVFEDHAEELFVDSSHLNAMGNRIVANRLAHLVAELRPSGS